MTITQCGDDSTNPSAINQQQGNEKTIKTSFLQHKNREATNKKCHEIISDGISNLHVILDFDHTLTAYHDNNGNVCYECHDMLYNGPLCQKTGENDEKKTNCRYNATFHSDISSIWADMKTGRLPPGQREWWDRFHDSMIRNKVTKQDIKDSVDCSNTILRPGAVEVLDWLRRFNVPTTIVSAGITFIITEFLEKHDLLYDNIKIVANVPIWGKDDVTAGWKEPLVISRNKAQVLKYLGFDNDGVALETENSNSATNGHENPSFVPKSNVILAGNSIGDSKCLGGVNCKQSLAFGFLHIDIETKAFRVDEEDDTNELPLMEKMSSSSTACEFALSKEGNKELENFLQHYDVVSCGHGMDFQYILNLFEEMEMNERAT
uniref:5'-nucleotidase n=1 Tax=Ditylum brightwellii TaxID=49249 RepID=A0A7S4T6G2_9STRA